MTDPRLRQLAENLVRYSCRIEPGEKVLIEIFDCEDIVCLLYTSDAADEL